MLRLLQGLVGSDGASFQAMDSLTFARWHQQDVLDDERGLFGPEDPTEVEADPMVAVFRRYWWSSRCSLIERTGAPVVTSDRSWYSERELMEDPLNRELLHVADEILVGHPVGPLRSLRILLRRDSGSPFGERELVIMRLLHPHLQPLLAAAAVEPPTLAPVLTPRQLEILRLVKFGMPNRLIARSLGISEGTVRKHLENSYERLGVQNRVAAVAVALDHEDADDANVPETLTV